MVAAGATRTRWAPLSVSSTRVLVPASTALTKPVPAPACAEARGSSAAAADRTDAPGGAGMTQAPSSSATAIMIGPLRLIALLLCVGALHLTLCCDERVDTAALRWRRVPQERASRRGNPGPWGQARGDLRPERVRLIKWAQGLGFTLREIRELARIPHDHVSGRPDRVRTHAAEKMREIDDKILRLRAMRRRLLAISAGRCRGDCPILREAAGRKGTP